MRELDTLLPVVASTGPSSIYDLARALGWSYGKTERHVKGLIAAGKLHTSFTTRGNRAVRLVSTVPIEMPPSIVPEGASRDSFEVQEAFKHLYGVFKELKSVHVDPTRGLLAYCERVKLDPPALIALLDRASASMAR